MEVKGDFKAGVVAGHRFNPHLNEEAITATKSLTARSKQYQRLSAAGAQDVNLPDATTLLPGWEVTIIASGAANLAVKNGAATPVLQKTVAASEAYRFILMENGSDAGVWRMVKLSPGDAQAAARFVSTFDATTSWGVASGGFYSLTITEATHGMGVSPSVQLEESSGADFVAVLAHECKTLANGDVVLTVTEIPDSRFAGRAILS